MKTKHLLHLIGLGAALLSTLAGAQAASITGTVFFDFNGNGLRDAVSEYGLPQWSLQLVPVSPAGPTVSATTDVNGHFNFGSLAAGDYTLAAVNPSPWLQTSPGGAGTYAITLATGTTLTGKDFGCKQPAFVPQIEWQKSFGGGLAEYGGAIQTSDGGYLIGGGSRSGPSGVKTSPNYGGSDFWIVKLDAFGNQLWDRSFGGPGDESILSFKETDDGGFILAGPTTSGMGGNKTSPSYGGTDCYVVRTDANGNKLWETTVGGDGNDWEYSGCIIKLHDGSFLMACDSTSGVSGNKTTPSFGGHADGWVVKLDDHGNKLWEQGYGALGWDQLGFAWENDDDTILLCGNTESAPASGANGNGRTTPLHGIGDYWLVKIDSGGTVMWDATFGGTGENDNYGFARTPEGGAVLAGTSDSGISGNRTAPNRGGSDGWVVKVNANGNKQWDQSYGGTDWDEFRGGFQFRTVVVMPDGRLAFAGDSTSDISGNKVSPYFGRWDYWVVVTEADGTPVWQQDFGGSGDRGNCGVMLTQDGGLLIMGGTGTSSNDGNINAPQYGGGDILIIKLAPLTCAANTPVTLLSASADCGQKQIPLNFSAPLNPASALLAANYTITGGPVPVQAVSFGASTLQVILNTPALLPGVIYTVAVHGLTDDCGNSIAPNSQLTVTCPGEIRGNVFSDDLNHNCIKGTGEFGLADWPIQLSGPAGVRFTLTDNEGNYLFAAPAGAYTVGGNPSPTPNWAQECPANPATYSVALADGQIAAGKDFAMNPAGPCVGPDLQVEVASAPIGKGSIPGSISTPCCGASFTYTLKYRNFGNADSVPSPQIWFYYPVGLLCSLVGWVPSGLGVTFVNGWGSSPAMFTLPQLHKKSGYQTITLTANLCCDPLEACDLHNINTVTVIGTVVNDKINYIGDCNPLDNFVVDTVTPCCSFDPNDCTVTPAGCGPQGFINRDQTLSYLVQFQNVGGGAAHQVVVNDVLDAGLDISTLEILDSSHPNLLQQNGRELKWTFPSIELPSSSVDAKASHGYVYFRIRPLANAPAGTVINNNAEVIFDFNAPLATITTTNTITEDPVPVAAFTVVPHHGTASAVCDFIYTGGTPGAQCRWNFGPDAIPQTSTALNPVNVSFTTPGTHLVSLQTTLGSCAAEPAVQLVTVGRPQLSIAKTGTEIGLTWQGDGFVLQETDNLTPPVQWQTNQVQPNVVGDWYFMTVPNGGTTKFYRLAEP